MDPGTAIMLVTTAISTIQSASQAKAQARAQRQQQEQQIAVREQQQALQEKQQREEAEVQQAKARAAFGARGVSSGSGSANALVDGIAARTEQDIAENRQLSDLGIENLRANQAASEKASLLQTQNNIMSTVVGTAGKLMS